MEIEFGSTHAEFTTTMHGKTISQGVGRASDEPYQAFKHRVYQRIDNVMQFWAADPRNVLDSEEED